MAEVLGIVVTTAEYNQSYRKAAWGKFPYPVKKKVRDDRLDVRRR